MLIRRVEFNYSRVEGDKVLTAIEAYNKVNNGKFEPLDGYYEFNTEYMFIVFPKESIGNPIFDMKIFIVNKQSGKVSQPDPLIDYDIIFNSQQYYKRFNVS